MNEGKKQGIYAWLARVCCGIKREPTTQTELMALLQRARQRHLLNNDSLEMIEGVLGISALEVSDIMVPRSQMKVIHEQASIQQIIPIVCESTHSRYPVVNEEFDEVLGILLVKDIIRHKYLTDNVPFDLRPLLRSAMFVPESKRLDALLKEFQLKRVHMAIVVDEYGTICGLVTIEDILEKIVGDIEDEHDIDQDQTDIVMQAKNKFLINPHTSLDDFNDYFSTQLDHPEFNTVGGWVMSRWGRIPKINEIITVGSLEFKILDSDGRRIRSLQVVIKKK